MLKRYTSTLGKKSAAAGFIALSLTANLAHAQIAKTYDYKEHSAMTDPNTGYSVGMSLYQIKTNEMGNIISDSLKSVEHVKENYTQNYGEVGDIGFHQTSAKEMALTKAVEAAIESRNLQLIDKMNALPMAKVPSTSMQVAGLSSSQIISTAQSIEYTPANDARPELKRKYDPKGAFGFCFLRAHYYALSAVTRGLDVKSVKKVFLVGTMMPLGLLPIGTWQFHVATAIRGLDGQWYVLDNHMGIDKTYTVSQWYNHYNKFLDTRREHKITLKDGSEAKATAKALMLYFTNPWKIGASSNNYNKEAFYGADADKNGSMEPSEIYYNGIFPDVDSLFLTTRKDGSVAFRTVPFCSKERYKFRTSSDPACNTAHALEQNEAYERKVESWKQAYKLEKQQATDLQNMYGGGG